MMMILIMWMVVFAGADDDDVDGAADDYDLDNMDSGVCW